MTYTEIDGILYPNVVREGYQEGRSLGKYGEMRARYLKENDPLKDLELRFSGKLLTHLYRIDDLATERVEQMVESMAAKADLPDKMEHPVQWAQHMSMLKAQAEEVVIRELICTDRDVTE